MGSRAVVVVCRDEDAARRRFGVAERGHRASCYTRTGRRFFDDAALEARAARARPRRRSTRPGCWDEFETDWVCLDCELMPWSAKAQELLRQQYAAVGAAAARGAAGGDRRCSSRRRRAASDVGGAARRAIASGATLARALRRRVPALLLAGRVARRPASWRRSTCWRARARCTSTSDHVWHMETLGAALPPPIRSCCVATPCTRRSTLTDPASEAAGDGVVGGADRRAAARAWSSSRSTSSRAAAAGSCSRRVKCRGREYLRIIYGPEYTAPEQPRAAARSAASGASARWRCASSRSASRRWSASSRGEPLRRVHECVFGVLALESEPVDPRL